MIYCYHLGQLPSHALTLKTNPLNQTLPPPWNPIKFGMARIQEWCKQVIKKESSRLGMTNSDK